MPFAQIAAPHLATTGDEIANRAPAFSSERARLMARYYFDTRDGDLIRDDTGIECASLRQVLAEATSGLADFAREAIPGAEARELAVQVRDEQDRPVMRAILRMGIEGFE